jgi:uncharacterized membrane protein
MSIGPVQLLVIGFSRPDFEGEIAAELARLRESDTVKVIDAMVVYKDAQGELSVTHLDTLTDEDRVDYGATLGALIGLGFDGEQGAEAGAMLGAEAASEGIDVVEENADWDVLAGIPDDSAAALVLLEHHWAVPLRDAIARAGGFRIDDGFISPLDLVEIGLLAADEVDAHALSKA